MSACMRAFIPPFRPSESLVLRQKAGKGADARYNKNWTTAQTHTPLSLCLTSSDPKWSVSLFSKHQDIMIYKNNNSWKNNHRNLSLYWTAVYLSLSCSIIWYEKGVSLCLQGPKHNKVDVWSVNWICYQSSSVLKHISKQVALPKAHLITKCRLWTMIYKHSVSLTSSAVRTEDQQLSNMKAACSFYLGGLITYQT